MNNTLILGGIIILVLMVTAVIGINAELQKRKQLGNRPLESKSLNRK